MTDITHISIEAKTPLYQASGGPSTLAALRDIKDAFRRSPIWLLLAWQDVKLRYRGSVIGPFWLTISMGIMILAMGTVYSHLLKTEANDYFPFLTLGLMLWALMATLMQDACMTFISSAGFIKQIRLPYTTYALRTLTRNLIVYAHNFIIYIIVIIIFGIWPGAHALLFIPGLMLFVFNAFWLIMLLAMLCARYRDITPIINSLVQIIFFVTPVIWSPSLLDNHKWVIWINPFYHFLELMRAPLLGHTPEMGSYLYAIATTIIGAIVTFIVFRRYRARIAYWV
jgi:lipopolysaccharide transport system permease protein